MVEIVSKEQCIGCMVCAEICPYNAVICSDKAENGYYYPIIAQEKCIECGLCKSRCPQYRNKLYNIDNKDSDVYLSWAKDSNIRENSSSGGVFSVFAEYFLSVGGVVIGAAYNEDYSVSHIAIESKDDLYKLRLSKYVQSDTSNIWKKAKEYIDGGRLVLFSGVPCQIAALKSYFDESSDNLYTIDLLCRGVPSPVLWQDYLKSIREQWKSQITYINYRYKGGFGWSQRKVAIGFSDGRMYLSTKSDDPFMNIFFDNISMRESCFECRYSDKRRIGDLTLGDFWAFKDQTIKGKEQGLSMILCNSIKGQELIKKVRRRLIVEKKQNIDISLNSGLGRKYFKPIYYDYFWKEYNTYGFTYALNNYVSYKKYNQSLDVYKKIQFLNFCNINIADILNYIGLDDIYIYGAGCIGKLLLSELCGKITIFAVFDQKIYEDANIHINQFSLPLMNPQKIPDDDRAIIITPIKNPSDIVETLHRKGISKKRLITLNVVLEYGILYLKDLVRKGKTI